MLYKVRGPQLSRQMGDAVTYVVRQLGLVV